MSAPDAASFHPLRALTLLIGAQTLLALLDATGKRLSHDMRIPLIALARHGGQAALMLLVPGPRMGAQRLVTRHVSLQVWRGYDAARDARRTKC